MTGSDTNPHAPRNPERTSKVKHSNFTLVREREKKQNIVNITYNHYSIETTFQESSDTVSVKIYLKRLKRRERKPYVSVCVKTDDSRRYHARAMRGFKKE